MERPTRRAWRAPVSGGPRRAANGDGTCPFVHTGRSCVCFSGHADVDSGGRVSVCAHGTPARVQSRTRGGRFVRLRVRLCTRSLMACAKSDTRLAVSHRSCPLVHTGRPRVCEVGHKISRNEPFLSVCAHAAYWRVQSRTLDRQNGAVSVRLCTPSNAPCAQADTTTGEGPGSLRVREGPTAGEPARQAETISSSQQGLPAQPLFRGSAPAGRSADRCATYAGLPGRIRAAPGGGALDVLRCGHGTKAFGRACVTPSYSWNATLGDK